MINFHDYSDIKLKTRLLKMTNKHILVTGGAGFIGSNIVRRLVMLGVKPKVLDNFSTGKRENLCDIIDKIEFIEGDIRDAELIEKILDKVEVVIHQAAIPSVPRSVDDPVGTSEVNIMGTLNLLNILKFLEKKVYNIP